jgi:hypothetical protein
MRMVKGLQFFNMWTNYVCEIANVCMELRLVGRLRYTQLNLAVSRLTLLSRFWRCKIIRCRSRREFTGFSFTTCHFRWGECRLMWKHRDRDTIIYSWHHWLMFAGLAVSDHEPSARCWHARCGKKQLEVPLCSDIAGIRKACVRTWQRLNYYRR